MRAMNAGVDTEITISVKMAISSQFEDLRINWQTSPLAVFTKSILNVRERTSSMR